jgi:carbamoyltransferase
VTSALGFKSLEHEYKVMGMAPYAKPEYYVDMLEQLRKLLWIDGDGRWAGSYLCRQEVWAALAEACSFERFDAIAGALQQFAEDCMLQWIEHWVRKTGITRIGCAGGVFMNVKANQRIAASALIEHMIVVPSCGDESTAIGAAVFGSLTVEPETPIRPATHLYLGAANRRADIEAAVASAAASGRFEVSRPPDINRRAAELLAAGEVIARCSGAMEFGARALGNRSILAHPARPELVGLINRAIKNRDFWMPFAPSILEERMEDYVVPLPAAHTPYMMVSFDTTPRGRRELAAALHAADGTCRPQCVIRSWNPDYHALISAFAELTGIGAVLNTSFNLHGEPIVMSPADAIHTVERSGLRYLILDDYLLEKKASSASVEI